MVEREGSESSFSARLQAFHNACVALFEKNRAFRMLVIPMLQAQASAEIARQLFESLRAVKSAARLVVDLGQPVRARIREEGIRRGWEVELFGGVEPGWHLGVARVARETLVESELGRTIDEERWNESVSAADFLRASAPDREGALHQALYVTDGLRANDERMTLALGREYLDLQASGAEIAAAGENGERAVSARLNHELNLVTFDCPRDSVKLAPAQMDLVVLCAFATKKGTRLTGSDFKSLGALGNPSSLFSRLDPRVQALIEKTKKGWHLRGTVAVEQPRKLQSGRTIDWKTLTVSPRS